MDLVDNAGRGEMENAGAAVDGGSDGVVVEEVDLEETEASFSSSKGLKMFGFSNIVYITLHT